MVRTFFQDRKDAGQKLIPPLLKYKNQKDTLVIGLPRGGVITAIEVAKSLNLPLDLIIPRKIGAPGNQELAIGAICENEIILNTDLIEQLGVSEEYIQKEIEKEKKEAHRRYLLYRKEKKPLDLLKKTIIIIDDGIATGSTMFVAIKSIKKQNPKKIIVAVPVAPPDTLIKVKKLADEVICLYTPANFFAIGQFYEDFKQTEDEDVINIFQR